MWPKGARAMLLKLQNDKVKPTSYFYKVPGLDSFVIPIGLVHVFTLGLAWGRHYTGISAPPNPHNPRSHQQSLLPNFQEGDRSQETPTSREWKSPILDLELYFEMG